MCDALQEAIEGMDAEQVKQEFDDNFDMALELLRTRRRLQQYEAQCIARTDGMPADAIAWEKYRLDNASDDNRVMRCRFIRQRGRLDPGAPDYRPGCSDPCYLHIVDLE